MIAYNRRSRNGLIGSIYSRDINSKNAYIGDYRIPIFDQVKDGSPRKISGMSAGEYLVQLSMPDGRVIRQNFEVIEGEDADVNIQIPHESPHEWSGLQSMSGEFSRERSVSRRFTKSFSVKPSGYSELSNEPERGYSLSLLTPGETPGGSVFEAGETLDRLSLLITKNMDVRRASDLLGQTHPIKKPSLDDKNFALFRFGHSGLLEGEKEDSGNFHLGPGSALNRHFLIQRSKFGAQIISLPTPWMTPEGQASVELLLKTHNMDGYLDYSMTIGDPMVNSALGYINIGALQKAKKLIDGEHAKRMLFQKISYPLAATIGGYILVLGRNTSGYRADSDQWKNWVNNLDHWFEWLPDGAILNATMCLMDKHPDLDSAREVLQRAFSRGLPVFTFGLKYLMDGLRYFVSLDEPWAKEQLKTLQPIAMRADPGIPFLSVSYAQQWEQKKEPMLDGVTHAGHA